MNHIKELEAWIHQQNKMQVRIILSFIKRLLILSHWFFWKFKCILVVFLCNKYQTISGKQIIPTLFCWNVAITYSLIITKKNFLYMQHLFLWNFNLDFNSCMRQLRTFPFFLSMNLTFIFVFTGGELKLSCQGQCNPRRQVHFLMTPNNVWKGKLHILNFIIAAESPSAGISPFNHIFHKL